MKNKNSEQGRKTLLKIYIFQNLTQYLVYFKEYINITIYILLNTVQKLNYSHISLYIHKNKTPYFLQSVFNRKSKKHASV